MKNLPATNGEYRQSANLRYSRSSLCSSYLFHGLFYVCDLMKQGYIMQLINILLASQKNRQGKEK